jgi:chromosome segregation ATPase
MTQANESSDRLDRLEALMDRVVITVAETSQQIKEVSIQIKAQATFHDRFEQELAETRKLIQSNAKAIQANSEREIERAKYELAAIREVRRSIRSSHAESLDRNNALQESIEDLRDEIKEINERIDRQNPPE